MRETLQFIIDLIEIIPNNSICHIQAPSVDESEFLEILDNSKYSWARQIILNSENKNKLKNLLLKIELEDQFQTVTIEKENEKLFEGYDGMEIGEISKNLIIPEWFKEKYIETEYCILSQNW